MITLLVIVLAVIIGLCFTVALGCTMILWSKYYSKTDKPHHNGGAFE